MESPAEKGAASGHRLAFAQTSPRFGDVAGNLDRTARLLEDLGPCDLLVLPELFSTGYVFRDRGELADFAEDREGPSIRFLTEQAARRNSWVSGGFAERDGDHLFNSAALAGPDGSVRIYRKIHLFDRETEMFDPGDRPFEVHRVAAGPSPVKVGMMICFDWFFPESARCLALEGAEILLHPSNLVMSTCQSSMPTRCLENAVFAVTANRVGEDDRGDVCVAFTGASLITGPDGKVLASAPVRGQCTRVVEVDVARAREKRITERNDRFRDRRPAMYAPLGVDPPR